MSEAAKLYSLNTRSVSPIVNQDAEFSEFWANYPRKLSKGEARKAWAQVKAIRPEISKILAAIESAKQSEDWREHGGKYIPYPATWLRAEGWDDVHEIEIDPLPEKKAADMGWSMSSAGIEKKGRELGMSARPGENYDSYKARIFEQIRITGRT